MFEVDVGLKSTYGILATYMIDFSSFVRVRYLGCVMSLWYLIALSSTCYQHLDPNLAFQSYLQFPPKRPSEG